MLRQLPGLGAVLSLDEAIRRLARIGYDGIEIGCAAPHAWPAANVIAMFGTFHVLYRNEPSSDYVYEMGEHLAHVHFADTRRLPPGEGAVDWFGVMQALQDIKSSGHVTMEIGFNTRGAEPDRHARSALAYLKALEKTLAQPA